MTYIKINKPSLDYHLYSDFHVFTMNNFVRNVMKHGQYKKAIKLVRLGLLFGKKELFSFLHRDDSFTVLRTYRKLKRTELTPNTQLEIALSLDKQNEKYESKKASEKIDTVAVYGPKYFSNRNLPSLSFSQYLKSKYKKKVINKLFPKPSFNRGQYVYSTEDGYINTDEDPITKSNYHYNVLQNLDFKKIYSIKPRYHYFGVRSLTVFDMVAQVYKMLTGVWYMRKSKVSGRTILIPSPLRPYRRVITVTKMLMGGIRKRRREDRANRPAMIKAIGWEFYWLLLYYSVQYTSNANQIDNSYVWLAKTASHKELVANLKNIKHLKYF